MTSRLSILVEKPSNAFSLSASETKDLREGLTRKQLNEVFKKSEESMKKTNDSKQIPVPQEILSKPFEIVK